MQSTTTGGENVAVGRLSLNANTTGNYNTAVGYKALEDATTPSYNTALGRYALQNLTLGASNTAIGHGAGGNATNTGNNNVFVGASAGGTVTSGSDSVIIGNGAGNDINGVTTGGSHVLIGKQAFASSATVTYEIVLGRQTYGKGNETFMCRGSAYQGNNSSSWTTTSDERIKKNIVDNTIGLDAINQIRVRNFEYRTPEEVDSALPSHAAVNKEGVQLGCIAQEIKEVLPDVVKLESTGAYSVNPDNLTWYLINAVKELSAEVEALKSA